MMREYTGRRMTSVVAYTQMCLPAFEVNIIFLYVKLLPLGRHYCIRAGDTGSKIYCLLKRESYAYSYVFQTDVCKESREKQRNWLDKWLLSWRMILELIDNIRSLYTVKWKPSNCPKKSLKVTLICYFWWVLAKIV